ncbi:MAG: hypothetical protein KGJ93_01250 [Patescibacteria group bacterium]|nr:hypothetical protein [Patescibacteria group bacterium]
MGQFRSEDEGRFSEQEALRDANRVRFIMISAFQSAMKEALREQNNRLPQILKDRKRIYQEEGRIVDEGEELIAIGEKYWPGFRRINDNLHIFRHFDEYFTLDDYKFAFDYLRNLEEEGRKNFFSKLKSEFEMKYIDFMNRLNNK